MNPDRNKGGMTVNALLLAGLVASTAIPIAAIAILSVFASQRLTGSDATTFVLVVIACAIVVLLGVILVNYFIQNKIRNRILGLVDVCRDYAGGDRTVRAVVYGDDEFAMLSMSLNTLLDNQGTAQGGAAINSGGSDASALQAQIEKLLQEVSAVGDGDLRVQAEVTPDTLGVLADSFNYMIEELAKVVGRVQTTAVQVTNATRRILDRSAELAQSSETQVGQISQTTEAVEALAIFIQNVARNAQLSVEVAQEALRNASSGQQSVRQTIDGMMVIRENVQETSKKIKRLGERSNEIGEIVRIIEDIADQTNLLALNAAIQSAMAGEHGRGFAVVADEIRLLAERSTKSTKRIDTLVKSIQGDTYEAVVAMEDSTQEVVKGSQLADEAGRSLNSIYSAVERQAQMIESIARSANDQTTVSEAVAIAMGQISEITQQTNVGTQEAAASVSYLAELSEQLRASVSTFRLPDRGNEMIAALPGMTSVRELNKGNGNQLFSPALRTGASNDWGQISSGNFPSLPEPGNSDNLIALTSSNGQFNFNNQDLGNSPGFGGQTPFGQQPGTQPGFGQFGNQAGFGDHQLFENQQAFGGQPFSNQQGGFDEFNGFENPQAFGGQPFSSQQGGFSAFNSFENPQNFGGGQPISSQGGFGEFNSFENHQDLGPQQFGGMSGFGGQGQPYYPTPNQFPNSQPLNSSLPQQPPPSHPERMPNPHQRWQGNSQQNQNQPLFGQEQKPFQSNG